MIKSQIYYAFLKRFDNGKKFTKREALLWYGAYTEKTDQYPFNGYDLSAVMDAWRLNSKGNVVKPRGELKVYSEVAFSGIFKTLVNLAGSSPEKGRTVEGTGEYVIAPDGTDIEVLCTYWTIQETRTIIPAEWRRKIHHLTGKGNRGFWRVSSIHMVITRKTEGALTHMQSIEKTTQGKAKKAQIELKNRLAALGGGNSGEFHPDLNKLMGNLYRTEANNISVVQTVITSLGHSPKELTLEEGKEDLLTVNEKMKEKDARIKQLEAQLAVGV